MDIQSYLQTHLYIFLVLMGFLGLLMATVINALIYRLPIIIKEENYQAALEILGVHNQSLKQSSAKKPCSNTLKHMRLSARYVLVGILSTFATLLLALHYGPTLQLFCSLMLTSALLTLFFIDSNTMILPDQITSPTLWIGLFVNTFSIFTTLTHAVLGAIYGYLFFYIAAFLIVKIRKIQGLGGGDLKLISMLGAWFGWQILPAIVLVSSLLGTLFAIIYIFLKKEKFTLQIPFGPFLSVAGFLVLFMGPPFHYLKI